MTINLDKAKLAAFLAVMVCAGFIVGAVAYKFGMETKDAPKAPPAAQSSLLITEDSRFLLEVFDQVNIAVAIDQETGCVWIAMAGEVVTVPCKPKHEEKTLAP